MIWLLRDFDLLAVALRAAVLAFEALTVGGIAFLLLIVPTAENAVRTANRRLVGCAAVGLFVGAFLSAFTTTAILIGSTGMQVGELAGANYFLAGIVLSVCSAAVLLCSRVESRWATVAMGLLAAIIVAASVSQSHAFSRIVHRWLLAALTAGHHVGVALWVGAMPFLLLSLRRAENVTDGKRMLRRYSTMAFAAVTLLAVAGAGLGWLYLGFDGGHAATALYGTAYGVMLLAKIYLLVLMLALGGVNVLLARGLRQAPERLLGRLRRFSEVEIGLGFTAIIVAASMTSQPPAVDLRQDRLTGHEIVERFRVALPEMRSPAFSDLAPPASIDRAVRENAFRGVSISDAADRAWSEYNHHGAGLIVLVAGGLALLSRRTKWARHWPLAFAGLALFILLRADPENWPLGPRPFWASLSQPDVLEHRLSAVLVLGLAAFEWGVQAGWWDSVQSRRWLPLAFPGLCAVASGLMLLHSHALGNVKEELLAEISHTAIALLGATAGWARWLDVRSPRYAESKVAGYVWPVCLMLVGTLLLNYRES